MQGECGEVAITSSVRPHLDIVILEMSRSYNVGSPFSNTKLGIIPKKLTNIRG